MSFRDKTFCASPNCINECGRKMTDEEKEYLKELAFRGLKLSILVSYTNFCDQPELTVLSDENAEINKEFC